MTQISLLSFLLRIQNMYILQWKHSIKKNDGSDGKHSATIILLCKIPNVYQFLQIKNWSSLDIYKIYK